MLSAVHLHLMAYIVHMGIKIRMESFQWLIDLLNPALVVCLVFMLPFLASHSNQFALCGILTFMVLTLKKKAWQFSW